MSTQKHTVIMTSLYKSRGEAIGTVFKTKNQGQGERNQYTGALENIYLKE